MAETVFSYKDYDRVIETAVSEIKKLGTLKGGEYAGDTDRLANFRRNGRNLGLNMETVWAVYAGKHWDALQQFIQDMEKGKTRERLEPIEGRVDDLLVYLILFKCMLVERTRKPEHVTIDDVDIDRSGRAVLHDHDTSPRFLQHDHA